MTRATRNAEIVTLPSDAKARRARRLQSAWAKEDDLLRQLAEHRAGYRALQGEVSRDCGYLYTIGREKRERAMKGRGR